MIRIKILILLFTTSLLSIHGQNVGIPFSKKFEKHIKSVEYGKTPKIDIEYEGRVISEFNKNFGSSKDGLVNFANSINVSLNTINSGKWLILDNGDKIWQLIVECPSSESINILFDSLMIPDGSKLVVYNKDHTQFSELPYGSNSIDFRLSIRKYATELFKGDYLVIEYYKPDFIKENHIISLEKIVYGYKNISGTSEVNIKSPYTCDYIDVNCSPDGDFWQDEKKGVMKIIINEHFCSGSLINNSNENGELYVLTANHCIQGSEDGTYNDAIYNPDASNYIFQWNYERVGCDESNSEYKTTIGATVIANNSVSDFALLKLIENPFDLSPPYEPFFNGWENSISPSYMVAIHHPAGRRKKISYDYDQPLYLNGNTFQVQFDKTVNGKTILLTGSSGSPIFNEHGRILGQAWSVTTFNCYTIPEYDIKEQKATYGRFDKSWDNSEDSKRRLKDWLDPDNQNEAYLNGSYCDSKTILNDLILSYDDEIKDCFINVKDVVINNSSSIIFDAAKTVYIEQDFSLELGSELIIK